jgi:hypothetical protein
MRAQLTLIGECTQLSSLGPYGKVLELVTGGLQADKTLLNPRERSMLD